MTPEQIAAGLRLAAPTPPSTKGKTMPNKSELLVLAHRVEKARGPDRELDAAIHDALGLPRNKWVDGGHTEPGYSVAIDPAAYTASFDAVMTLDPPGFESEEIFVLAEYFAEWASHIDANGNLVVGSGNSRILAQLSSRLHALAREASDAE